MANDIGWELYRSFLGVLREGSLSAAARSMGVAQPTVGRHVAALEKSLGLVLFIRTPGGLAPTEAAQALRSHAETLFSTAEALKRTAESQGDGVRGTVRVTASEVIGVEVLPPIVTALQQRHPDLRVELLLSNRVHNLLRQEADIAVRMGQPQQERLIVRRIGRLELGLHAHRDYLQRYGTPTSLAALSTHRLIGFDEETPFLRAARDAFPSWRREAFAVRSDSDVAQLAMMRAGGGIGICQVALARREPTLIRLLPDVRLGLDACLTLHEDLRASPRCRATLDALAEGLERHLAAGA
jgi:DNA-binding transcriptional LysR family regulator